MPISALDDPRYKTDETFIQILQRRAKTSHSRLVRDSSSIVGLQNRWYQKRGVVYLIYLGLSNIYKIGHSTNADQRLAQISAVELPYEMELIHSIKTDDRYVLESSLHQFFADERLTGEWFELDSTQVAMIKSMKEVLIHDKEANDDPYNLLPGAGAKMIFKHLWKQAG